MPGATQELYDQIDQVLRAEGDTPPDGLIVHSAGPMPDGFYVYDIWESREHFQRFAADEVGPAVEQVTGAPMAGEPQFFDITNLILAGQTVG